MKTNESPKRSSVTGLTGRGKVVLATATAAAAASIVTYGHASHPQEGKPTASDPVVSCELPVQPRDTLSGLADTFHVGQKNVKVYPPNSVVPEKSPAYEMQPGDIAVARVGAMACKAVGGEIGDPSHPAIIE